MENKELSFNAEAKDLMKDIAGIAKTKKNLEKQDKEMRKQLLALCDRYGIDWVDNEYVKITRVASSQSVSVDLKRVQISEPETYKQLMEMYPKKTIRKSYIRITTKG